MKILSLSDIQIPENRVRCSFDEKAISELKDSIEHKGLFHAPVMYPDGVSLWIGERRFRAIQKLADEGKTFKYNEATIEPGQIPVVIGNNLQESDLIEGEVEENFKRVDLTWQEHAAAVKKIHDLRKQQAEERGEKHTISETAGEINDLIQEGKRVSGSQHNQISEDLELAKNLDNPAVAAARDRNEALKVLRREKEREKNEELASRYKTDDIESQHRIFHGDMQDVMPTLEPQFDCIIADPPWGVGASDWDNQGVAKHSYNDDWEVSHSLYSFIFEQGYSLTKEQAHLYVFCDYEKFYYLKELAENCGWYVFRTPIIWYKGHRTGLLPLTEHGPRRTTEPILYAIKGKKPTQKVMPDLIHEEHDYSIERAAHKPPEVYLNLMQRSCRVGDRVLDPCCGSGPVFPAASNFEVVATGIELDKAAYGQCLKRLQGGGDETGDT